MTNTKRWAVLRNQVAHVLRETDIRPDDKFLLLGGNSLLALQVKTALRDEHGYHVDLAALLTCPLGEIILDPVTAGAA